ncbi:type I secretion system permease/ATPase [Tabrizicola aquatica]|uniref:type I secretion system permease/ATPase n=1 Tax=Tabrizicola aquatica TaxID=909926 RepID=UPI002481E43E|nr:type I secretion system permease/ATPase [Tabrizicola aquatica]
MKRTSAIQGVRELRSARRESAGLILATVLFSAIVNALMLTGPLYMLQVYDRVLGSGSEATLVALSGLVIVLFLAMGVLEYARGKVMAIVGARFQERLDRRVFEAAMRRSAVVPNDPAAMTAQRDLEAIRAFLGSPVLLALMDLPWTPFFLAAIFIFHSMLGWLSIAGGAVLVIVTVLNQVMSKAPQREVGSAAVQSERMADQLKAEAETLQALGMSGAGYDRWQTARRNALRKGIAVAGLAGGFRSLTKTFRLFLQSAMLGLGAWLVLQGELSAGAMIAASILMGRALAPIEMAVGQWAVAQKANEAWHRLAELLTHSPQQLPRTALPRPKSLIEVEGLSVGPPGEQIALLRAVSFRLEPGKALGVIGPSGAGKSTLARALTGVWRPLGGKIRLDGAALEQYDPDVLGRHVGYLPQRITLFDGTIAENIARLDVQPDSASIVEAARKADAHDMIVRLPQGYDTRVSAAGGRLSGGQMQRIGLARALYGDPVLLILDEPNSNLDNAGSMAVNAAIRTMKAEGKSVLIMAHRPAAIQECDLLLVLEDGMRKAFGPRDQVLRDQVKNHTEILKPVAPGNAP